MISGSSVSPESPITGCSASTPQNCSQSAVSENMEDSSVTKEGTDITVETNLEDPYP